MTSSDVCPGAPIGLQSPTVLLRSAIQKMCVAALKSVGTEGVFNQSLFVHENEM